MRLPRRMIVVLVAGSISVACAGRERQEADVQLPPGLQVQLPSKDAPSQEELLRRYWAERRGETAPTVNDVALPPPSSTRASDSREQRRYDASVCSERGDTGCLATLGRNPE